MRRDPRSGRPDAISALAYDEIKPVAVGMNGSLQRFNLVRIERHFRLRASLSVYRRGHVARDGRPFRNQPVLDEWPSRILCKQTSRQLPGSHQRRPACGVFGDLKREQMRLTFWNNKEIRRETMAGDRRGAQHGI